MRRRSFLHHFPVIRSFAVRPRLATSILIAIVFGLLLKESCPLIMKMLVSWDVGAGCYLVMTLIMMGRSDDVILKRRAATQDEGALIILGFAVVGVLASLAAIFAELVSAKSQTGVKEFAPILLAAATVVISWFSMQTIFAVHYAHEYYNSRGGDGDGGLEFPAKFKTPDYWDFMYFSFVIGTAAATADINITSRILRRIVTLHCILVFFFNTSILALAINVGASLVG